MARTGDESHPDLSAADPKSGIYSFSYHGKHYRIDAEGHLLFPAEWDEGFAEGNAPSVGIPDGLTEAHWRLIRFLRDSFDRIDRCPTVYVACRRNSLGLGELRELFPAGYLRGVCKLAGVTYREAYLQGLYLEKHDLRLDYTYDHKAYGVDAGWFMVDPSDWDQNFALHRAYDMKYPEVLTERHFEVLRFLGERFSKSHLVPSLKTVEQQLGLKPGEMEGLFPNGYHFGACRLAGLPYRDDFGAGPGGMMVGDKVSEADKHRTYHIDVRGFLIDPTEWNRGYAALRAIELNLPATTLTEEHWTIIDFLRRRFTRKKKVPTIYETCEAHKIELDDMARLFPEGFHRGAVKLAGLRVR